MKIPSQKPSHHNKQNNPTPSGENWKNFVSGWKTLSFAFVPEKAIAKENRSKLGMALFSWKHNFLPRKAENESFGEPLHSAHRIYEC